MKTLQVAIAIVLAASSSFAQPREGRNMELSLSGTFQKYSSETSYYYGYETDSEDLTAFLVSPRLGFFVLEGLEIEPEILLIVGETDPVYVLNGFVSYNFLSEGQGVPFLLVGYGIANTVPFFNLPRNNTNFMVDVLNAGGGLKLFVKEDIAVRIEYRFQRFTGESGMAYHDLFFRLHRRSTQLFTHSSLASASCSRPASNGR